MIVPVQPHFRAVPTAWTARLAAPRAEAAFPAAQPGRGDHRRGNRRADHRGQRVQAPDQQRFALDLGVPEPRALLAVPVDPFLHRVDAGERQGVRAGQQRRLPGQFRQELPACLLQLGDVAPGITAQVRAQRGQGADPAEQDAHRAVPQHVHVIDAVRARGHPGDQAPDLQVRIDAAPAARRDVLRNEVRQAGALRQGHHRDQSGVRHEIRVVERCAGPREAMQQSHLQGVLSNRVLEASQLPSSQFRGHLFILTRRNQA